MSASEFRPMANEQEKQDTFIVLDDEDLDATADEAGLREALEEARDAWESGIISEEAFEHIEKRVAAQLRKCSRLVRGVLSFLERSREEMAEEMRREEEARARREEEERRRQEEEERRRRQEAARRAEEERLRREEEERLAREPELTWRELESLGYRIRTLNMDQGAFAVKKLFEEALKHGDWQSVAAKCRERYRQEPLPWTFSQIKRAGVLKPMDTIFPPEEENPVVVPGFLIAAESSIRRNLIFVIVNAEDRSRFRYSPDSLVRLDEELPA